jgi:hypothetical protein
MTARKNYQKLKAFLSVFPKWVETKKDLLSIKDKRLVLQYYAYRSYFRIDKRLKPENVIKELKKFKWDNIYFKSEELGIELYKNPAFTSTDKYKSSGKLIAKATKAMLDKNIKLKKIHSEIKTIDIGYKRKGKRKIVTFDTERDNLNFLEDLDDNVYVNIGGSSYNKNVFDFVYDYHNQSEDFFNHFEDFIREDNFFLYNW